jgi:predicted XRE-type DNA-binding protein
MHLFFFRKIRNQLSLITEEHNYKICGQHKLHQQAAAFLLGVQQSEPQATPSFTYG